VTCHDSDGIRFSDSEHAPSAHGREGQRRRPAPQGYSHAAGAAIALALASLLSHRRIRRDVAMTGEIDTKGRITGACWKNENALNMLGLRTVRTNGNWDQYGQVQKEHWFMFANSLNRSLMQLTNSNEKIKM